jgi:hypothetical protein
LKLLPEKFCRPLSDHGRSRVGLIGERQTSKLVLSPRVGRHCQTKFNTAYLGAETGSSFAIFAHESLPRSSRFDAENCLYLFTLTGPCRCCEHRLGIRWRESRQTSRRHPDRRCSGAELAVSAVLDGTDVEIEACLTPRCCEFLCFHVCRSPRWQARRTLSCIESPADVLQPSELEVDQAAVSSPATSRLISASKKRRALSQSPTLRPHLERFGMSSILSMLPLRKRS